MRAAGPVVHHLEEHRLLAALPRSDRRRTAQKMHLVSVNPRSLRYESTDAITDVFFPLSAVFSLSGTTSEGHVVEVGQIGCEGIAGVEVGTTRIIQTGAAVNRQV